MSPQIDPAYSGPDDGHGWMLFAASFLGIAGIMRIFDGIWALRFDGDVPDNLESALLGKSLSTYGWLWLIVGVILLLSSFAVLQGSQFARWIGIIAGAIMAITAIWWIMYYPVWSLVYVLIGMLVVYALAIYGGPDGDI